MTLLRFPTSKRGYLIGILAGVVTAIGVNMAGHLLVDLGLHADLTYLDDALLGALVALLVFVLHRHHDLERQEYEQRLAALIALHKGIAADLQVIASITGNAALAEIANDAAIRIHAIIETLPTAHDILAESDRLQTEKTLRRLAI